jgi:hypothetical protein
MLKGKLGNSLFQEAKEGHSRHKRNREHNRNRKVPIVAEVTNQRAQLLASNSEESSSYAN